MQMHAFHLSYIHKTSPTFKGKSYRVATLLQGSYPITYCAYFNTPSLLLLCVENKNRKSQFTKGENKTLLEERNRSRYVNQYHTVNQ